MAEPGQGQRRGPALAEPVSLTFSEANLFDGMGGERVGRGDERGLGAVAIFVSHVRELGRATLREGEAGNGGKGRKNLFPATEA